MILMTSNGLSSSKLQAITKAVVELRQFSKAVIIVTADHEFKEKNWNVVRISDELRQRCLNVQYFDFDCDNISALNSYDVIVLNGGNPFYLLDRMRKAYIAAFLKKFVNQGNILIGISAGSCVLQKTIDLIDEYSSEMNFLELDDLSAMNLVDVEILPHYRKFIYRFKRCEERCQEYEKKHQIKVFRLNDGDGVIIENNIITVIRK